MRRDGEEIAPVRLTLLGGAVVETEQHRCELSDGVGRVVAYVALEAPDRVQRSRLAGELWPECHERRAVANLRSALWRARRISSRLLEATATSVRLSPGVWLDVHHPVETIRAHDEHGLSGLRNTVLLPGCVDEWVLVHRERVRQRLLRAIEQEAHRATAEGRYAAAIDLALEAIEVEPLRETPHRLLIEAHLAEGNFSEAVRHYRWYEQLLLRELGVRPSAGLDRAIRRDTGSAAVTR